MIEWLMVRAIIGVSSEREGSFMRKKMKWIVSTVVILLIGLIVFAPVPIPHFTNFTSVFDVDGQEVDVTIRVRFVHFKPLFFQYGKFEGFPVGSIKIYDNSEKEEICDLKFDGYLTSVSEHTYMALVGESDRRTTDENGLRFVVSDFGGVIWDDTFDNVVVAFSEDVWDLRENPEGYETTTEFYAYMASKKDLTTGELVDLFYGYRGMFIKSS